MWAGGIEKEQWPEMDYLRVQNKDARNENHYQVLFIYQKVSGLLDKERSPMKISKMGHLLENKNVPNSSTSSRL